jgi:hypothetical protein
MPLLGPRIFEQLAIMRASAPRDKINLIVLALLCDAASYDAAPIEPPIAVTGTFVDLSTDHLGHLAATACNGVEQLAPFPLGPAPQFRSSAAIS